MLSHNKPESADNAESNVSLLEQRIVGTSSIFNDIPWSEIITDYEIKVEGKVLLAKLRTESLGLWASLVYGRDILLLHES